MEMSEVTIYTKTGCPYCDAAKEHYKKQGVDFDEINVYNTAGAKEKAIELSGGKAIVPVIVENGCVKVGFNGG